MCIICQKSLTSIAHVLGMRCVTQTKRPLFPRQNTFSSSKAHQNDKIHVKGLVTKCLYSQTAIHAVPVNWLQVNEI